MNASRTLSIDVHQRNAVLCTENVSNHTGRNNHVANPRAARPRIAPSHTSLGEGVWDHRAGRSPAVCHLAPRRRSARPWASHTVRRLWWSNTALHRHSTGRATAMTLTPGLRKFALAVHLTASLGWIGAVVAYLALGVSAVISQDAQTVRAAWIAMEVTGWFAIVPLALAALLTGLIISLGTA